MNIIYQDKDIIAVKKPAGINVHSDEHYKSETLIQALAKKFPEIKNVGDDPKRPGVVHRLDKDTSGILIVARNQKSFEYLKEQFKERKIKKTYLVLVYGKLGKRAGERGVIDLAIARSAKTPILRIALAPQSRIKTKGKLKKAVTEYKVINYLHNPTTQVIFTLLEVYPQTGRTHQIRVHLKSIGYPVVCDKLYAGKKYFCPSNLKRHFLHAYSLEFTDLNSVRLKLEAGLPNDLQKTLQNLQKYDKEEL